jgi:hypothetical protein
MLAFRSEAHVEEWCRRQRVPGGATLDLEQIRRLGEAWYSDKLSPEWRRATPEEAEAVFAAIGLTGDFWRLR